MCSPVLRKYANTINKENKMISFVITHPNINPCHLEHRKCTGCPKKDHSFVEAKHLVVMMIGVLEWFPLKNGQLPLRERDAFHCRRLSWISYQPTTLFLCFNISPHFSFFHYLTIQGGRNWQPFVGSKNGNKNFQQTRTYNFCVKCVVFARNCKFAKLTQ